MKELEDSLDLGSAIRLLPKSNFTTSIIKKNQGSLWICISNWGSILLERHQKQKQKC